MTWPSRVVTGLDEAATATAHARDEMAKAWKMPSETVDMGKIVSLVLTTQQHLLDVLGELVENEAIEGEYDHGSHRILKK